MSKNLVIVESPTKAKTIGRFLGSGLQVQASMGHVRDLPQKTLGVDVQNNFTPNYELTANGRKIIRTLRQAAAQANDIYLATDHDREGEAIAWHLQEILRDVSKANFHRITFHEITKKAIDKAFATPGVIAENLVAAQQARRVLDRLVGYQVSPLLWHQVKKGTSAGRVQSVALRLIVEREREILAFEPQEYWNLDAWFESRDPKAKLKTRLSRINDQKVLVSNGEDATKLADALQDTSVSHQVIKVQSTPRRKSPPPPFITSTLQQAAGSALKISTSQTMRIAQQLYEGIELGGGGPIGLITYMRTDSVHVAREAQAQALDYIEETFGRDYVPARPNVFRSRKSAQEAHEAIRPTDVNNTPDRMAQYLTPQQARIYRLIWNRFLASQMAAARQVDHVIEIESSGGPLQQLVATPFIQESKSRSKAAGDDSSVAGIACRFHASARETVFPGYLIIYNIKEIGEEEDENDASPKLPDLKVGMACDLLELTHEQCFTSPPSRYSEAALVKALEQNGVGRPSTYASTVNTIQERKYVSREKSSLLPTELGFATNDYLVQNLPHLFDVGFTADMENELDQIEEGNLDWIEMINGFYNKLQEAIKAHSSASLAGCTPETLAGLLSLFPADFPYEKPLVLGRRTYDDGKFITSIGKQLQTDKPLSERQWDALLSLVAKYSSKMAEIMAGVEKIGMGEIIKKRIEEQRVQQEQAKVEPEVANAQMNLLQAMTDIKWNPPVTRGKRVFDDGKFFHSLFNQAQSGRPLSPAQLKALLNLAANYAAIIPGYETLLQALTPAVPATDADQEKTAAPKTDDDAKAKITIMAAMAKEITEWTPPAKTGGRRAFNEKEFVESVLTQFEQKGSLSDRQIAALARVLVKHADQIPDYQTRAREAGVDAAAPKPKLLDETCPQCGANLIVRTARGRTFTGCSAFPKCRYIAK